MTTEHSFGFQNQMAMSEGVSSKKEIEQIILACFPHALKAERATVAEDKHGTDYWVTTQSEQKFSVDVKVRGIDYSKDHPEKDDLALEIWSVVGRKVGWTRDIKKRTDYILWIWRDTGRWVLIPFPMLCSVFIANWEKWRSEYASPVQHSYQNNSRWDSQCVFVPRRLVWQSIYSSFGGSPTVDQKPRQVNPLVNANEGQERARYKQYYRPQMPRGGK